MKSSSVLLLSVLLGACCILVAADESATWATAHCACTKERDIVCGADGTSYLNRCWAECSGTTVEHEGACGKLADDVSACDCPKDRALVCGADGHTYLNECWAACVGTEVEYEGACHKVADVSACDCPKDRALVCGEDGVTYLNECWAFCSHTFPLHQGPCYRALEHPPCACTKERNLACGADGHTYLNPCWAACSETTVAHDGACKKASDDELVASKRSKCRKRCGRGRAHPFCGADGVTYPSECLAGCAGTDVIKPGFCEKCPLTPESKKASLACDTKGFTWYNKFWLACAGAELAHEGACATADVVEQADVIELASSDLLAENVISGSCDDSCDKHVFARPICGEIDGEQKTYPGVCAANCAGARILHFGACGPPCPYPAAYGPVCDTNGYTWISWFELQCAKGELAHPGACKGFPKSNLSPDLPTDDAPSCSDSCVKTGLARPVCGKDDHTYASECALECAGTDKDHPGYCQFCPTPRLYRPVCDTNGYTWVNKEALACAKAEKAHDGPCLHADVALLAAAELEMTSADASAEEAVSTSCDDSCDKHDFANPVCGGDNKTYPGQCAATCAGVEVVRRSTCARCKSPMTYAPVCDTRGYTWVNEGDMKCAGGEKAKDGPCADFDTTFLAVAEVEKLTSSECQKACPKIFDPVCGMNNKSYANECRMECDGVELKHEGRCAI